MSQITKIVLQPKLNFCMFNDGDILTDYIHSYHLRLKELLDGSWNERLADSIEVEFENNEMDSRYYKRLEQIAKKLNYKIETTKHKGQYGPDYETFKLLRKVK